MAGDDDRALMARALELAERGWGRVAPNPMVGAVIVDSAGAVVGEGWHAEFGGLHAEAAAIAAAGDRARGGTIYVSLEPCSHHGKQPPCTDAIIEAGITRVVAAVADPDSRAGGGAARLRAAGVAVEMDCLSEAASRLNAPFFHARTNSDRPWMAVKLAVSLDGMVADSAGNSRWISGPEAREWVHRERARFDAIGVGGRTVLADSPSLTVRGPLIPRVPPVRVVFDRSGAVPLDHPIFQSVGISGPGHGVPLVTVRGRGQTAHLMPPGVRMVEADSLAAGLSGLRELGIESLMVEGGGRLAAALLEADLVDRICQIQSPVWLGSGIPAWPVTGSVAVETARRWRLIDTTQLGNDVLMVMER